MKSRIASNAPGERREKKNNDMDATTTPEHQTPAPVALQPVVRALANVKAGQKVWLHTEHPHGRTTCEKVEVSRVSLGTIAIAAKCASFDKDGEYIGRQTLGGVRRWITKSKRPNDQTSETLLNRRLLWDG